MDIFSSKKILYSLFQVKVNFTRRFELVMKKHFLKIWDKYPFKAGIYSNSKRVSTHLL